MPWQVVHEKANYKTLTDSRPNPSISSSTAQFGCFLSWFSHALMNGVPFCSIDGNSFDLKEIKGVFLIIGKLISTPVFPGQWGDVELGRHNSCIWYTCTCKQPVFSIYITDISTHGWAFSTQNLSPGTLCLFFLWQLGFICKQVIHGDSNNIPIPRVFFSLFVGGSRNSGRIHWWSHLQVTGYMILIGGSLGRCPTSNPAVPSLHRWKPQVANLSFSFGGSHRCRSCRASTPLMLANNIHKDLMHFFRCYSIKPLKSLRIETESCKRQEKWRMGMTVWHEDGNPVPTRFWQWCLINSAHLWWTKPHANDAVHTLMTHTAILLPT